MGYGADAMHGMRQEFAPCFAIETASYGHAMVWTFQTVTVPNIYDTTDTNSMGFYARRAWGRNVLPFAGIVWNHERNIDANRTGVLITRGYAPKVLVDNRVNVGHLAGNNWAGYESGWAKNALDEYVGKDMPPGKSLGNPTGRNHYTSADIYDGEMWPHGGAWEIIWEVQPFHVYSAGTVTAETRGSVPAFVKAPW